MPKYANPADFYLDVLMQAKKANKPIAFNNENYEQLLAPEIENEITTLSNNPFSLIRKKNSPLYEMQQVARRGFLNFVRNPMVLRGKILTTSIFYNNFHFLF